MHKQDLKEKYDALLAGDTTPESFVEAVAEYFDFDAEPLNETPKEIINALVRIWSAHPEWRFCQLLFNTLGNYSFYVEDSTILKVLNGKS